MALTIPEGYGWVLLAASSSCILGFVHTINTSLHRKAAGVLYPAAYAKDEVAAKNPKAFAFNCAQRAHVNYAENHPSVLAAMLIAGLRAPLFAATAGGLWVLGRTIYMYGYSNPAWGANGYGRAKGAMIASPSQIVLLLAAVWSAVGAIGY